MGIDRTRSSWLARWSLVLLLVVAVAVVFLNPTSSGGAPPLGRLQVLHGTTGQGTASGIVGRIGFAMRGTLGRGGFAQGAVRLAARFTRGQRQLSACDSQDVAWAASAGTSRQAS